MANKKVTRLQSASPQANGGQAINDLAIMTKKGFDEAQEDREGIKKDVGTLKKDVTKIRATMVTKSYLDDKVADLRGDTVARQRKADEKINHLIEFLYKKKILASYEVESLKEIQVFPLPPRVGKLKN